MAAVISPLNVQVGVDEIRQDFLTCLSRVDAGETLIIVKNSKPAAELGPVTSETVRPFGLCAGEFVVPDDFDDPLPENIIREFEGQCRQIPICQRNGVNTI